MGLQATLLPPSSAFFWNGLVQPWLQQPRGTLELGYARYWLLTVSDPRHALTAQLGGWLFPGCATRAMSLNFNTARSARCT